MKLLWTMNTFVAKARNVSCALLLVTHLLNPISFLFMTFFSQILSLTSSIYKSITTGCCIFHKKKSYDESDSDESASDIEEAEKADAEPKDGKIPAYQRHHA